MRPMSDSTYGDARFDMGRTIGQAFGTIGRNPVGVLSLSLLGTLASLGLVYGLQYAAFYLTGAPSTSAVILAAVANYVATLLLQSFLLGSLTCMIVNDLARHPVPFSAALATGLRTLLPVFVILIGFILAVIVGTVLLVVPGVLAALIWAVVVPVRVMEGTSVGGAFSRSAALTKNHRWAILGLGVCLVILFALMSGVVYLFSGGLQRQVALQRAFDPTLIVLQVLTSTLSTAISTATIASIYTELRRIKDGVRPGQLASVFE